MIACDGGSVRPHHHGKANNAEAGAAAVMIAEGNQPYSKHPREFTHFTRLDFTPQAA